MGKGVVYRATPFLFNPASWKMSQHWGWQHFNTVSTGERGEIGGKGVSYGLHKRVTQFPFYPLTRKGVVLQV